MVGIKPIHVFFQLTDVLLIDAWKGLGLRQENCVISHTAFLDAPSGPCSFDTNSAFLIYTRPQQSQETQPSWEDRLICDRLAFLKLLFCKSRSGGA